MKMLAALIALSLPAAAQEAGLDCTFTTVCSPLTDCQDHPGVPFTFDVIGDAFTLTTPQGPVYGTPLAHLPDPALAILFEVVDTSTILLTVAGGGQAVMTQQDLLPAGLQSISYFGSCEPAT